jgi:DinB superfamily
MRPQTPYSADLGDRDPMIAIRESIARVDALTTHWKAADFDRTYEPGKWPARTILMHLAHTELAFSMRVRMALSVPNYVVQPFDQDQWMAHEPPASGPRALELFRALATTNLALYESLSPANRATKVTHPEAGPISVDWIIHQSAGHLMHHVKQLERIKGG